MADTREVIAGVDDMHARRILKLYDAWGVAAYARRDGDATSWTVFAEE